MHIKHNPRAVVMHMFAGVMPVKDDIFSELSTRISLKF